MESNIKFTILHSIGVLFLIKINKLESLFIIRYILILSILLFFFYSSAALNLFFN